MKSYNDNKVQFATFAGGCFWCMVSPFETTPGIIKVVAGYMGGYKENPTYQEVCQGSTGHLEVVQITFDPNIISYKELVDIFWRQIDPTDPHGQFYDRGQSYKTAILYHNNEQKTEAEQSKEQLEKSGRFSKPIRTQILPSKEFFSAEDYHQDYHRKNPEHYNMYRKASGRDKFIEEHWND